MSARPVRLIFFLNIPLDWERFAPLWDTAKSRADLDITLVATRKFRSGYRGVIESCGKIWSDNITYLGLGWLLKPDALITVTESSARPHKRAHSMTKYFNYMGIPSVTIQHGYECVGINYADKVHTAEIDIAARHILTWQPVDKLPQVFNRKIGQRCVTAGYVTPRVESDIAEYIRSKLNIEANKYRPGVRNWILVTENLHWHRYDDGYRNMFMSGLSKAAEFYPDIGFIVKHHPAGRFLENMSRQGIPKNILLASDILQDVKNIEVPIASWLLCVDGLITTPSTTALDGALFNKPVIVIRNQLAGRWPYEPLVSIDSADAWVEVVSLILDSTDKLSELSMEFIKKNAIQLVSPDDILDKVVSIATHDKVDSIQ